MGICNGYVSLLISRQFEFKAFENYVFTVIEEIELVGTVTQSIL